MGWFFGFKLHLIINDKGGILNFMFTPGNVDDREPLYSESFIENVMGKLCGDKGYIGKQLFEFLFMNGIQIITKDNQCLERHCRILFLPEETLYISGVRAGQSIDVVLIPYIDLTLNYYHWCHR